MVEEYFENNPLDFFEILLLRALGKVYDEKKKTEGPDWLNYSNLLIDKFAIHSGSFFHLSKGIIERKISGEVRMAGYDLFTVNSTFRAMMETYVTFHHLYVEPQTGAEKEFRFLLWKLDSLAEKVKFEVYEDDFKEAKEILDNDKIVFDQTSERIENCDFIKTIPTSELSKIYNKDKRKYSWRFVFSDNRIRVLKIIELIRHTLKTRSFFNTYKYTSLHTHSNYLALEYFKKLRGKELPNEYSEPLEKLAVFLLSLFIYDIIQIDANAQKAFKQIPFPLQEFIIGITKSIKGKTEKP